MYIVSLQYGNYSNPYALSCDGDREVKQKEKYSNLERCMGGRALGRWLTQNLARHGCVADTGRVPPVAPLGHGLALFSFRGRFGDSD